MVEEEEFVQVIKDHESVIYKITTFYVNNEDDQKDLYQEIVFQLWKSFKNFKNKSKIGTWIYRIALNTAITQLRKSKKQIDKVPIDRAIVNFTANTAPEFEEKLKMLYAHIQQLSDLEKGIILLFLEKKSHEEIASICGLSISNVGTRISRIKNKLKTQIQTTEV